jgi:hypothetical protein
MYTVPYGLTGPVLDPTQNPKRSVQKFGHLFNFGFLSSTIFFKQGGSVADLGCLSRIPDPDFYPSRISNPGSKTATKERGKKKILSYFYVATNFTKFNIILVLKC